MPRKRRQFCGGVGQTLQDAVRSSYTVHKLESDLNIQLLDRSVTALNSPVPEKCY